MKTVFFKTSEAVASNCGTMEADTISKTGGIQKNTVIEESLQVIVLL